MLIGILFSLQAVAQYSDDFSDGDFTDDPTWSGEVGKFAVTGSELELKDAGSTGAAYLITFSSASKNAVWEFYHRYESNPSTSNRAEFYLMSDQADLSGPLNGYYLRMGEQSSTTDQVVFYRQNGSESSELFASAEGTALNSMDEVGIRIRVTRDDIGNWEIWADNEGDTNFVQLGAVNDNMYNLSLFSGVKIKYSSTRSEGYFFFDDFSVTGEGVVDSIAPELLQLTVLSDTMLDLKFSEAIDPATATDLLNYNVNNGIGFPVSAELISADIVRLTFSTGFTNGIENEISIMGIGDVSGNMIMSVDELFIFYQAVPAAFNEVLVTEIHPAPADFTDVPNVEFLEIHNPTEKAFQLQNWTLQDGSSTVVDFPSKILTPGEYAAICNVQYIDLFSGFGSVIGVDGLPSLNNSGDDIILRDENNQLIFHIEYDDNWYRDNIKDDGGWSLEMIDYKVPCAGSSNWRASEDASGGTPSRENSVAGDLVDDTPIGLIDVEVIDSVTIVLVFSEKINLDMLDDLDIEVDQGLGTLTEYSVVEPGIASIMVTLPSPMTSNILYTLTVSGVFDCNGNEIGIQNNFQFGLPLAIAEGDILINEILFNPFSGQVDYIEIYNTSDKLLSTSELIIGEAETVDPDSVTDFSNLNGTSKLIFPNDFLVFTSDPDLVQDAYFVKSPAKMLEVSDLPNYPDDEAVVSIFRSDLTLLDRVSYSDEWHYELLDDDDGVSLERISLSEETQNESNWHSASANAGFGTPTYMNSVVADIEGGDELSIAPEVFSPDNDGFEDFTIISYTLDKPDYLGNIRIFDARGREVSHLVRNETFGTSGFYKWDGIDKNGELARTGLYVVLIDLFDPTGSRKRYKREIALTTR